MKKSYIYIAWGVLYAICMALGFLQGAAGFGKVLLVASAVIFFLPPFYLAVTDQSRKTQFVLRLVSICVLALSCVFIGLNFASVHFSPSVGLVLYVLLNMVSTPMFCAQYWVLGLFLWACLLMLTLPNRQKK